jgi:hypothetical protein
MADEATVEPASVRAGDTLSWRKSLDEYPASDSWVLAYTLINSSAKITITAGADGADHLVSVAAAVSALYTAGRYSWIAHVSKALERHTVATGVVEVLPDLSAQATYDNRTPARQALDDVEAALRTYGTKAWMETYTIGGRSQKFRSIDEFMAFRDRLKAEVAREEALLQLQEGLAPKNQLYVRFRGL